MVVFSRVQPLYNMKPCAQAPAMVMEVAAAADYPISGVAFARLIMAVISPGAVTAELGSFRSKAVCDSDQPAAPES